MRPSCGRLHAATVQRCMTQHLVRVAVAQLDYHPAFGEGDTDALKDPLFSIERKTSSLLPRDSAGVVPPTLQRLYKDLQARIREAYLAQIRRRLEIILDVCRQWEVQLLVLPEYSVPAALLECLANRAGEMVVVAGTHQVDFEAFEQGIYERLGAQPSEELLGCSVCPVLNRGRLLGLVQKHHPAKPELGRMKPGRTWEPIDMETAGLPGPMAVLVCLDGFNREGEQFRAVVAEAFEQCRFLAWPAATRDHTLPAVRAKGNEDAQRKRRPALFSNYAIGGGSTVYMDEGPAVDPKLFPEHAGFLEPGEEGLIVADINLGLERPGTSTPYELTRSLVPFAAASLVYRGTEPDYARWLDAARVVLDAKDSSVIEKLKGLRSLLREKDLPLPGRQESARRRRLLRLQQGTGGSNLEGAQKLVREVVLPEDVLPLRVLRAALARGAANEVRRWSSELGAGEFGPVDVLLRSAWSALEKEAAGWTEGAGKAADAVSRAVQGERASPAREILIQAVEVLGEHVEQQFAQEMKAASALFAQGRYAEARDEYRKLLAEAERLHAQGAAEARPSLRRLVEVCRLNVAGATLNLQEVEKGKEILAKVDATALAVEGRLRLAEGLAFVGEKVRARELLPDGEGLTEDQRARLPEVEQLLVLLDGELPARLLPIPSFHVQAAAILVARRDLAGAADRALEALRLAGGHMLTVALATMELYDALNQTIYEALPISAPIPVEARGEIVAALEASFRALRGGPLPDVLREQIRRTEAGFRRLTQNHDALTDQQEGSLEEETAFALARQGRVEDALRALPPDDHPWLGSLRRVEVLAIGGEHGRALAEAIELASRAPERMPIHYLTAQLLAQAGQIDDAHAHAEKAYASLPGRGQALLLAERRLAVGQVESAWALLQRIAGDESKKGPHLLLVLTAAAERKQRFDDALAALREYLDLRPTDGPRRVDYAQFLHRQHRGREAAEQAWRAFQEHRARLNKSDLHTCGRLQRLGRLPEPELEPRIKEIAACLKERFPGDPEAEHLRANLLGLLARFPEDERIDIELMARGGFVVTGTSMDELRAFLQERRSFVDTVYQLARWGAIPIATACALGGTPTALFITRILPAERQPARAGRQPAGLICPPVGLVDVPAALELRGARLLVSDLELLLVEKLELMPKLREALGDEGRLLVFAHVANRIRRDAAVLKESAEPEKLRVHEAWVRRLAAMRRAEPDPADPIDDAAAARRAGAALIGDDAPADVLRLSPRALLLRLGDEKRLSETQVKRIEPYLLSEPDPVGPLPDPLPQEVVLGAKLLLPLLEADALDELLELFNGQVLLGPWAERRIHGERDTLLEDVEADKLADSLHQRLVEGISEGCIEVLPDRAPPWLPPLREPEGPWEQALVVAPLQTAVAYLEELLEHGDLYRLTADFHGSAVLGVPGFTSRLAWPSEEAYFSWAERLRGATQRHVTVPALVRMLVQDEAERARRLDRLAELGFPDALGPAELLRWVREYGGLDRGTPARILGQQEWMAIEPGHLGGEFARLRLANTYAKTICQAFCRPLAAGGAVHSATARELLRVLLTRQEEIARVARTNSLDVTLMCLLLEVLDEGWPSWKKVQGAYEPDEEGPAATLWKSVREWSGIDGTRHAAYGRALREAWRILDLKPDGPSQVHAYMLRLAHRYDPIRSEGVSLVEPELETVAILSACWKERPLATYGIQIKSQDEREPLRFDFESLLQQGAALLDADLESLHSVRNIEFSLPVPGRDGLILVRAPIEALLLRAEKGVRAQVAGQLKALQGVHDGELYRLLSEIEDHPDDSELLREYARRASAALFRMVRDDPGFLCAWPPWRSPGDGGGWPDIDALRQVLSEEPLPMDRPLIDILHERVDSTCWAHRADKGNLFVSACIVPGSLPSQTVVPLLQNEEIYPRAVEAALERLQHAEDYPAALLAGDVLFLRVGATLSPKLQIDGRELNLREVLPGRFAELIARTTSPAPDTLAAAEPAILRVVAMTVRRLAWRAPLPVRERLWLTYRLFHWLFLQLTVLGSDARQEAIRRLVALAPPPGPADDLWDPAGFDRDCFDYRLAVMLCALSLMEPLERSIIKLTKTQQRGGAWVPSSPALEQALLAIIERPAGEHPRSSALDFALPGSVPDLALIALLRLDLGAFARLSVEAQLRNLGRLPADPDAVEKDALQLEWLVLVAAADPAADLRPEVRDLLEQRARALGQGPVARLWSCMVMVSLFTAGAWHLEAEARALVIEHLEHEMASTLLGRLLLGVATREATELERAVEAMLSIAAEKGTDVVALLLGGIGAVAVHGPIGAKDAALDLLARLAQRDRFREDPRTAEVVRFFGMKEPQV